MPSAVIQAESLGKQYRRGLSADPGLRHALEKWVKSPLAALRRKKDETFWALQDVSLAVHEGEVLGLIGRNGAGKTTLLKILSRITKPTSGWAEIRGRVGSLLEVGTGFHPELTGRENAFLSGAILGMSKREIARKFDEIVAFAELEKFIDTAVKHYSSGMYVRLAFAVAAHLEPEILLVDEVLAVGDINFQKKCLGKMGDVARAGRTVVLVSHQLNQIRRLCTRVVWVDGGRIRGDGNTHEIVSDYESSMSRLRSSNHDPEGAEFADRSSESKGRFRSWEIADPRGENPHELNSLGPVTIRFNIELRECIRNGHYGVALRNDEQQVMWAAAVEPIDLEPGERTFNHRFPMLPLRPGVYSWLATLYEGRDLVDWWDCVPEMTVNTQIHQHPMDQWKGVLNFDVPFEVDAK